jgi:CheY-like chemotaxis protein
MSMMKIPGDSRVRHYLEQIHTASRRAIDLVGQILAFSRQAQTQQAAISLIPLVKETVRMLRETIPAAIEIKLNIRTEADTVFGNAAELYQIIRHLCTNAYQAMKDRSGLLEVELVGLEVGKGAGIDDRLRGLKPGSYLEMTVRDTGEGIDPIILERIFDPFFTTKKIGEGVGLGLSMVHGIVARYGGRITVESRVDVGSAFHIYLPLLAKTPEAPSREAVLLDREGRGRILLVDDEATVASATKVSLEECGYTVTIRTDSIEALETFRAYPDQFDLVMTDRAMPVMMGVDLAENILSIRPGIPVILSAGFIDASIEEKTAKAGIRAVVLKPLNMERLIPLIRNLLAPAS